MRNKLLFLLMAVQVFACGSRSVAQGTEVVSQSAVTSSDTTDHRMYPMADYENTKQYTVNDIFIHGDISFDVSTLANNSGLHKGDVVQIPGNYVTNAIKSLLGRGMFSDVDIVAEPVGDSVNFHVYLQERPKIRKWAFEGLRSGEVKNLEEKMNLAVGRHISDYSLTKNKELILSELGKRGFMNAEVDVKIENDPTGVNQVIITFVVDKKHKVKVGEITFTGNDVFTDKKLRRQFKNTHQKSWNIFKGARFDKKEYEEDKVELIDFYNSNGYRNAYVVKDSIYNIDDRSIGINLDVSEGHMFYFRNISWIGNTAYSSELLHREILRIQKGDIYDRMTLMKRLGLLPSSSPDDLTVTSYYQDRGYMNFQVEPVELVVGYDSIDVEIRIMENRPVTLSNIRISGNQRVNDEVIRRELMTVPGDLFSRSLLMNSIRRLAQMEHFDVMQLSPTPEQQVSPTEVDIIWPLTETASDRFELAGGIAGGMFMGSISIHLKNVSIKNFFKKGAWKPYPSGQNQKLSLSFHSNGQYYKAASLSFTEPWFGGRKPISFTAGLHYSDETDAMALWRKSSSYFRTFGATVGIGRRLSWPDMNFTLQNAISFQTYKLHDWTGFIVENGSSNVFALSTTFGRSWIYPHHIYPQRGSDLSLTLTLTPPYSMFDGKDYSNPNLSDKSRYGWVEYHKWMFSGKWYTPLSRNDKLVLMAGAEMGYLGHYNKNKLSPYEGFDMGGSGMTGYNMYGIDVIGMRGYEESALTPNHIVDGRRDYARVYNKFTMELRYPIVMQGQTQIYALTFAEAGNAYANWKAYDPFRLKRAAGIGVRLTLPMLGMIGLDWGYGFDHAVGENKKSKGKLAFSFGQQF